MISLLCRISSRSPRLVTARCDVFLLNEPTYINGERKERQKTGGKQRKKRKERETKDRGEAGEEGSCSAKAVANVQCYPHATHVLH